MAIFKCFVVILAVLLAVFVIEMLLGIPPMPIPHSPGDDKAFEDLAPKRSEDRPTSLPGTDQQP